MSRLENRMAEIEAEQARSEVAWERLDRMQTKLDAISETNASFMKWTIGTVVMTALVGLSAQFKAIHEVNRSIHSLEKKVIKIEYSVRRDTGNSVAMAEK